MGEFVYKNVENLLATSLLVFQFVRSVERLFQKGSASSIFPNTVGINFTTGKGSLNCGS